MAIAITATTKALKQRTQLEQQIIATIDGFDDLFGAVNVSEIVKFGTGHTFGEAGLVFGGLVTSNNSQDLISLEGTTTSINSQINIEDGLPNSISRFNLKLLDQNAYLTNRFRPGNEVTDMLGREVQIYTMFQGGSYPEDATRIFIGIIDEISQPPGVISLSISSPEKFRQNEIFIKWASALNGAINDSTTTVVVDTAIASTANLIAPADILTTYIKIGDEILGVSTIDSSTNLTVTRAQLGTTAASHSDEDEVESFYRLQGKPIDIALKLMLSSVSDYYKENLTVSAFNQISPTETVTNAIYFPNNQNVEDEFGITEGDFVTITGSDDPSNDVVDAVISGFGTSSPGSYVVVSSTLVTDTGNSAAAKFKSQYNTLPVSGGAVAGFGIKPKFIDVAQFQSIASTNSSFFEDNDFYIKDTLEGEDYIATKILFPNGILSTIRKARTSAVFLSPPVISTNSPIIDNTNVEKPENIMLRRSINTNFYNAIVWRFEQDVAEDKFLAGEVVQSADSTERIDIPNKVLTIDAPGLRDTPAVRTLLQNISERLLQRYRYGAETMEVEVNYRDSFNLDLRDAVIFDGRLLNIADNFDGTRAFKPRIMQIFNRSLNISTGKVKLTLVDSIYDTEGRYATVAPASNVSTGATTTNIPLKRSYSTSLLDEENEKWQNLIGSTIRVRSADFTYNEETVFNGFISGQPNSMNVDALSMAPSEDYIVELADYDESSSDINAIAKASHVHLNLQDTVVTGTSATVFDVADGTEYTEGKKIRVHNEDYSNDSDEVEITDITGNTITVESMGFTPATGDLIDRISYTDGGNPYLLL